MKNPHIQGSRFFLLLSAITMIGLGIAVGCCDKIQMHLWLNAHHTPFQDLIWQYYTYVGEWVPYVIVGLLLLYKLGWASFLLADVAISGGIGQIIKHCVQAPRPITYFAENAPDVQLPLVEGVPLNEYLSFPSGHTITFFALFFTLSLILGEKYHKHPAVCNVLSAICFILAIAGGYSRVYLSQHFTEDILGGIVVGVLTTIGLLYLVPMLDKTKFWNWNIKAFIHEKN